MKVIGQKGKSKGGKKSMMRNIFSFSLIALLAISIFLYVAIEGKKTTDKANQIFKKQKLTKDFPTIYPKQFNDRNITENAKLTDKKYKDVVLVDQSSLLGNVISSVIKNSPQVEDGLEKGTWLWTPIKYITPEYTEEIVSGAVKNKINVIYLSIDSYLDIFIMSPSEEKEKAKEDFDEKVSNFIKVANARGIAVDAEAGWQNWAKEGNSYKAEAILDYVIDFNKKHKEKFRGFQYDVEVYLLPEYQKEKRVTLYSFVNLVDQTVVKLNNTDLLFSVVIPEFYDGSSDETPEYSYRGRKAYTLGHLLGVLERRKGSKIIVMSYRNFANGENGTLDVSIDEINLANKYSTKIIIAQETGDVLPPFITFNKTSRKYYDRQVSLVENTLINDKSFGGIATHYVNSFLELK